MNESSNDRELESAGRDDIQSAMNEGDLGLDQIIAVIANSVRGVITADTEEEARQWIPDGLDFPGEGDARTFYFDTCEEYLAVIKRLHQELGDKCGERLRSDQVARMCFTLGRLFEQMTSALKGDTDAVLKALIQQEAGRQWGLRNRLPEEERKERADEMWKLARRLHNENPKWGKTEVLEHMAEADLPDCSLYTVFHIRAELKWAGYWPPDWE